MTVEVDYGTDQPAVASPITGAVDGVHSHNTEHVEEAISHLIQFFREGPRNQSLLTAIMNQVQEVEDANWAHHIGFDVDTAVGEQLDFLGKRVGERRNDRSDAEYRTAVRVRILVNLSNGRLEELIAIALGLSPGADVIAREIYPAALEMYLSTYGASTVQGTYRLLKKAKPAGVRLLLTSGVPVGSVDGSTVGGTIGSADGSADEPTLGFTIGGGT